MKRTPWDVGSFVHTYIRGSLGAPITREESERWRFLRLLYFLNDSNKPRRNWEQDIQRYRDGFHFERPPHWPERSPLVDIGAYCLMENHYHLLLHERQEGGISSFMKSLNSSISNHFKKTYDKSGLLDTPYESRVIEDDTYLRTIFYYINVKNPFETFPEGYSAAVNKFDKAYNYAVNRPFSSLPDYQGQTGWPIVNRELLKKYISINNLKGTAKDYITSRSVFTNPDEKTKDLLIDH